MFWKIKALLYARFRHVFPFGYFLNKENAALIKLLQPTIRPDDYVLDAGCGDGNATRMLLKIHPQVRVMGIDQSPSMANPIEHSGRTEIRIASLDAIAEENHTFDAVMCIGVTEYIDDIPRVLLEIKRATKPGAPMVVTFAPPVFWNYLRFGYGKTLRLISTTEATHFLQKNGWLIQSQSATSMQNQFLVRNSV